MSGDQQRAIWWLGACQCLLWGVLYYSFPVLLLPLQRDLGLSQTAVAGAFSLALLGSALVAPAVGRRFDSGQAIWLIRLGVALALAGAFLIAGAQSTVALYPGWLLLGLAMALLLYEPAFALVIRAVADDHQRLRALAMVTVLGGLASTLSLPTLALLIEAHGWRYAVLACAAGVLLGAWILETRVLPGLPASAQAPAQRAPARLPWPAGLRLLMLVFASGTLATMALITLLVPLLIERGQSPTLAATILGVFGLAQLPGRLWLWRGQRAPSTASLQQLPIILQAAGLLVVGVTHAWWLVVTGVLLFGLGTGLQTLVRPWLVQRLYGAAAAGLWNGEVARIQGFARAAGPFLAAAAATQLSMATVLAALGGLVLLTLPLARRLRATEATSVNGLPM